MDMQAIQHSFSVQETIGALLIGVLISCFLFGIATLQAYIYYVSFPEDRSGLKLLVAFVWLCELAHMICVFHSIYFMLIIGYANPTFLAREPDSLSLAMAFTSVIGFVVEGFFANRVRIMGQRLFIPIVCCILSSAKCISGIVVTVKGIQMVTLPQYREEWGWLISTALGFGVSVDSLITLSLCYYLHRQKALSLKSTARRLEKIMAWSIQTGLMTSVTSTATIITIYATPSSWISLAVFTCMTRMYSNSLFASLNSRAVLRDSTFNLPISKIDFRHESSVRSSIRSTVSHAQSQ